MDHLKVSKRSFWEGSLVELERLGCIWIGVKKRLYFHIFIFLSFCYYSYLYKYPAWFLTFWVFQRGSGYVNYTNKKQHRSSTFSTKNRDIQSWPSQFQQPACDLGSKEASCTADGHPMKHKPWEERHIHVNNKSIGSIGAGFCPSTVFFFVDYHQNALKGAKSSANIVNMRGWTTYTPNRFKSATLSPLLGPLGWGHQQFLGSKCRKSWPLINMSNNHANWEVSKLNKSI